MAVASDLPVHWLHVPLTPEIVDRFIGENVYNGDKIRRLIGFQVHAPWTDGIRREV
jgi:hypothetical protein